MDSSRYRLRALLRKNQWEAELLNLDCGRALTILTQRRQHHEGTLAIIKQTQSALRELYAAPEGISPERWTFLRDYLQHQVDLCARQAKDAAQAEAVYAQVLAQLRAKQLSVKMLEKHRERVQRHAEQEARVEQFRVADDQWLLRREGV